MIVLRGAQTHPVGLHPLSSAVGAAALWNRPAFPSQTRAAGPRRSHSPSGPGGPVADAFFVAFRIPNMFRRLVAEGAFAAAFVPMFSGRLESHGKEAARAFAEQVLAVLLGALMAFTVAVEIAMPLTAQRPGR